MKQTSLVATLTTPPDEHGGDLRALPTEVTHLEVRADLVGDLDPDWLRDHFSGALIYTLRSRAEGGKAEGGKGQRQRRMAAAAPGYDLVDLEAARDLHDPMLDTVPVAKRLLSWHGKATHLTGLRSRLAQLTATPARYYKLIPEATQSGDGIRTLSLLHSLHRDDVIAFCAGAIGTWTRLVAPRLGSPLVYGSADEQPAAPGQLSIARLIAEYGLPDLPPVEALYGIVGKPVAHSLSPRLHNGAYRALGVPALYVPFHVEIFGDFWLEVVESGTLEALGLPLVGLSITSPYKEVALVVSGASSPRAQHVGAANTLVCTDEVWEAEITDPEGVTQALAQAGVEIRGQQVAVVGCGGAGKAAAYGLQLAGAAVTLVNRSAERGEKAAIELALPFVPLADFDPGAFDLLIHATALGHGDDDPLPFPASAVRDDATVVDLVYGSGPTPLLAALAARGVRVIDGRAVLLHQALGQFQLMTGQRLDPMLARQLIDWQEDAA